MSKLPGLIAASAFAPLGDVPDCSSCAKEEPLGFKFAFAYQPIIDVQARKVYGHEALVRGPNGESALSVLGQVNDQNRYRFDQACRVKAIKGAAQLQLDGYLSINFLPNAIYQPEVCIRTTLEASRVHGFGLDRLIFEATEGERIEDGPRLAEVMREYKRYGFLTALDDFGAGYAGLTLLADFQPDIVKLDMALVRGVDTSIARQKIVRALMGLCQELGILVIGEGVETAGERDFLRDAGVRLMQGYLFSRPAFSARGIVCRDAFGPA